MEPMLVFSTGLVVYYMYRALLDVRDDLRRERAAFLLKTAQAKKTAEQECPSVTQVVGLEKLARIVASRNKRFKRDVVASSLGWQRQGAV